MSHFSKVRVFGYRIVFVFTNFIKTVFAVEKSKFFNFVFPHCRWKISFWLNNFFLFEDILSVDQFWYEYVEKYFGKIDEIMGE